LIGLKLPEVFPQVEKDERIVAMELELSISDQHQGPFGALLCGCDGIQIW
jgi:hypothetical protein